MAEVARNLQKPSRRPGQVPAHVCARQVGFWKLRTSRSYAVQAQLSNEGSTASPPSRTPGRRLQVNAAVQHSSARRGRAIAHEAIRPKTRNGVSCPVQETSGSQDLPAHHAVSDLGSEGPSSVSCPSTVSRSQDLPAHHAARAPVAYGTRAGPYLSTYGTAIPFWSRCSPSSPTPSISISPSQRRKLSFGSFQVRTRMGVPGGRSFFT